MLTASDLAFICEATPYTYLGDSHCGAIGTRVYQDVTTKATIVTRLAGIWRFVASDVVSEDGMIGDQLMQTLRRAGAFQSFPTLPQLTGLRPIETTFGQDRQTEQLALTGFANDSPYVLVVGEINNRYILQRLVDDDIDFSTPFDIAGLERLSASTPRQTIGAANMADVLLADFGPLFRGLQILRDVGLRSIYLHSLPPPARDDEDSARVLNHRSPGQLRYKLAMFTNFLFERVCKTVGIGFINTWPLVTEGNLLRPEFYLDGLHLNHRHAELSVGELHRQFTQLKTTIEAERLVGEPEHGRA